MSNNFNEMSSSQQWSSLVGAATRALRQAGLPLKRVPARGRSNIWDVEEGGRTRRVSIRTTRDRWFAFPPQDKGSGWKTLDSADVVVVAAVDDYENPQRVEVYKFEADEVRRRFNASYAARIEAGQVVRDGFGMWLGLDEDDRGLPASVGAGLATAFPPIAIFPLDDSTANAEDEPPIPERSNSVGEVLKCARSQIATLSGVPMEAVRLDCRIVTWEDRGPASGDGRRP